MNSLTTTAAIFVFFFVVGGYAFSQQEVRHAQHTNVILDMLSSMEARLQDRIDSAMEGVDAKARSLEQKVGEQKQEAMLASAEVENLRSALSEEEALLSDTQLNYTLKENRLRSDLWVLNQTVADKLHQLENELQLVDNIDTLVNHMESKYYFPGGSRNSPANNCSQVMAKGHPSGAYWIKQEEDSEAYRVYCANNLNKGGWMLALNLDTADGNVMWWGNPFWTSPAVLGDVPQDPNIVGDYKGTAFVNYRGAKEAMLVAHVGGDVLGWRSFYLASQAPLGELINGGDNVLISSRSNEYFVSNQLPETEVLVRSSSALILNHCVQHNGGRCTSLNPQGSDGDRIASPESAKARGGLGNWHRMGVCPKDMSSVVGVMCDGGSLHTASEAQQGWGSCAKGGGYFGKDALVEGSNTCQNCESGVEQACYAEMNGIQLNYALFLR